MDIRGIVFAGTGTAAREQMTAFVRDVLGLEPVDHDGVEADLFDLPDGSSFAVASPQGMGATERSLGFLVGDLATAVAELRAAAVAVDEHISGNARERYVHFRAPDGQLYELIERRSGAAAHWDDVYGSTSPDSVSWFEARPETSLRLLRLASPTGGSVVDVGAGASFLADALVEDGWSDVTVLDLSAQALEAVRTRLGGRDVSYVVTDVLSWRPQRGFDTWHDRAVFHFLAEADQQREYVDAAAAAVVPGGAAVLGVFAEDGPTQCSGLPTARHSAAALAERFAASFVLEHSERVEHVTPSGVVQPFTWVVLRRTS